MVTLVYDTFLHILEHTFIPSYTNTLLRLLILTHQAKSSRIAPSALGILPLIAQ